MKFFITIIFLYTAILGFGQENSKCGSATYETMLLKKFPSLQHQKSRLNNILKERKNFRISANQENDIDYTIPVVVHIIYNNAASNIPNERIFSQIKILNEDYSKLNKDTIHIPEEFKPLAAAFHFNFKLATRDPDGNVTNGIVRKKTNISEFTGYEDYENDRLLKSISQWPPDKYLNIWVTTLKGKTLGYAITPGSSSFPDLASDVDENLDGVVIQYWAFGENEKGDPKYNKGRTCTHEVGHWLGLRHIWGDAYCGDDVVDDTPLQEGHNQAMQKTNCTHFSNCIGSRTRDMSSNYMDYSPDECMNMFTNGQKFRARTVFETNARRSALKSSPGICNPDVVLPLPHLIGFEENQDSVKIFNRDSDYSWKVFPEGGFGKSNHSLSIINNQSTIDHVDYFETPAFDFLSTKNPVLEFSVFTSPNSANQQTDSLIVSYRSNCKDYQYLRSFQNEELTHSTVSSSSPSQEQWKKIRIPLEQFAGKKIAQFKFENYSKGNGNLFIDDINIYDVTESLDVVLFPNPADHEMTAQIRYKETSEARFYLYNSIGKLLDEFADNSLNFNKKIYLKNHTDGMYFIKTVVDGQTKVNKFLIHHP